MRLIAFGMTVALLAGLLVGCAPEDLPSSTTQPGSPPKSDATSSPAPATPEGLPAPTSSSGDTPNAAKGQSAETFREALTAREAYAIADEAATATHPDFALYEVLGCHKAAPYGHFERDSHLVEGTCAQWMFFYVRPVDPDTMKGYHALFIRVGPNGVLETLEEYREEQVRLKPEGDPADWLVDSTRAIEIAESEGGRAHREANPTWDTARFEADRNAVMIATLEFTPYWDSASGIEHPGSKGIVWVIKYPPLDALLFVIDANTGEVLLTRSD